mmetsp:Transcript_5150/g.5989  ORF Transcript_5150/g.5989 Transcript_5150/m.5989 type:complete len:277 (-) Transcript_5150:378-1208(-)|eukprot:CAMPEP_0194129410 /NCGR_PEP_ID=MMETSP0152-20130528/641_1 /TAXON_ID=1049557 /ORGANISM="Thalassiothrix antarctica, Strain L6-D1" /LENGTH=276 /DNA_ID=CAMNT_0038823595 /DNA_START=267 /DNA_END=1097 /DNA_ORIENTATION=-
MVRGIQANSGTNVVDTRLMSKSGGRRRGGRFSFFTGRSFSSTDSTSSTISDKSVPKVRFASKPTFQSLEAKSPTEKAAMFYTRPELQQIAAEIIKMVIMDQRGMPVNADCGFRGLENMKSGGISDNSITDSRKRYIRKIVAEHRALRRNRKPKEFIRERIYAISVEETQRNRDDGVKLGEVDAKSAGIRNQRQSHSFGSKASVEAVYLKPIQPPRRAVTSGSVKPTQALRRAVTSDRGIPPRVPTTLNRRNTFTSVIAGRGLKKVDSNDSHDSMEC